MRLGVISDTHGYLRDEVLELFSECDHILHAGDVGSLDIIAALEALAPVTAVYGNTDDWDVRRALPRVAQLQLEGIDVVVTHGDQFGTPTPELLHAAFPEAELLVFGHTHRPLLTLVDVVVTAINPGAAGRQRIETLPSVGILELEAGIPPRGRLVPMTG
ncbi:MAG: metallophosphatase family protein [Gemmatimonadales bacterium]|nr:metallophosphatase family protein [Gemmatimonadales bacterium]